MFVTNITCNLIGHFKGFISCSAHRQLWACKNKAKSHVINNLLTLNGQSSWTYLKPRPGHIDLVISLSIWQGLGLRFFPLRVEILEYWMVTYILHLPGEELKSRQCVSFFLCKLTHWPCIKVHVCNYKNFIYCINNDPKMFFWRR